ncbi:hypothetical protein B0J18DRAFT_440697 [Chaetomium sp. MPI-SDFR-AT-0129]|nr:hypothetical protein B0J18DRAFT_440697 [Chaetomium sp. MPI-SDFR-AT-0129]
MHAPHVERGHETGEVVLDRFSPDDDTCTTTIRYHARDFHVEISSAYFRNSPTVTSQYRGFLAAAREDTQDEADEEEENPIITQFHTRLLTLFQPLLSQIAPDLPPAFDPQKLASGAVQPLLSDYLFPEEYHCRLEATNDTPRPVLSQTPPATSSAASNPDFVTVNNPALLSALAQHVPFFHPSAVQVSFRHPSYGNGSGRGPGTSGSKFPAQMLVDLTGSGTKTICFLKTFSSNSNQDDDDDDDDGQQQKTERMTQALQQHLRILESPGRRADVGVPRLLGVVAVDGVYVAGLLVAYISPSSSSSQSQTLPPSPPPSSPPSVGHSGK